MSAKVDPLQVIQYHLTSIQNKFPEWQPKVIRNKYYYQRRLNIENWELTNDIYLMMTKKHEILNIRMNEERVLEYYNSNHDWRPDILGFKWLEKYGMNPAAVDWETDKIIDYYLTFESNIPERYKSFMEENQYLTLRFPNGEGIEKFDVNMIYGSALKGWNNGLFGKIFKEFPKTTVCSIYYHPGDLIPKAALVVE